MADALQMHVSFVRPIAVGKQGSQKSKPLTCVHFVAKYWPIFKLFQLHILWKICVWIINSIIC